MQTSWLLFGCLGVFFLAGADTANRSARTPGLAFGSLQPKILVVMDERPQMEVLAGYLRDKGNIECVIVDQKSIPGDWSVYPSVIGYIHGRLEEKTELKIIEFTRSGGRFVCLHHMISSGKSRNKYYFDFLGVRMDGIDQARQPAEPGGHYAWREGVEQTVVDLNSSHYVTSNGIKWPGNALFSEDPASTGKKYAALTLEDSEVYMNVKFTDGKEKTVLLGYKYQDDRNGVLFQQTTDGWIKPSGKGWIVYLQMGHSAHEYENPVVAQMVLNAITWTPNPR